MLLQRTLLAKAKKGNNQAFIDLMQDEKVKLYRMAYIYTRNEQDALDVVQETVTKAWANIQSVKEEQYFSTWIMKICMNTALEMLRKSKKVVYLEESIVEQEKPHFSEEKMDLLKGIEHLEEKYKTVILLKYYRNLQTKEIAELLNCPEGTVKTNLHRGIQQLRKYVLKGGTIYGEQY